MTTATLSHLPPARPAPGSSTCSARFWAASQTAFAMARRYDRLNRMTTSELTSLGLSREDIATAAVNGLARR